MINLKASNKIEVARAVVKLWEANGYNVGKVWTGGDVVRVYYGKGFLTVGTFDLDCRKLDFHNLSTLLNNEFKYTIDSTLPKSTEVTTKPLWQIKGYLNQLDFDMENPQGMYFG